MRIAIDPVPVVIGMYAYVGDLLARAVDQREADAAAALARRIARQNGQSRDREAQKLVRALHADVKTADKLLKKTADVWKISQETDLVDLVLLERGAPDAPRAYVLLKPKEVVPLMAAIREAAVGAGESEATLEGIDEFSAAAEAARPADYFTFGIDPWTG